MKLLEDSIHSHLSNRHTLHLLKLSANTCVRETLIIVNIKAKRILKRLWQKPYCPVRRFHELPNEIRSSSVTGFRQFYAIKYQSFKKKKKRVILKYDHFENLKCKTTAIFNFNTSFKFF